MKMGMRELRDQLSNVVGSLTDKKVVFITKTKDPIAVLVHINTLSRLAEKAGEQWLTDEIQEALEKKSPKYTEILSFFRKESTAFLERANSKDIPASVADKIDSIRSVFVTLITEEATVENVKLLDAMVELLQDTVSPIAEKEYYYTTMAFANVLKNYYSRLLRESKGNEHTFEYSDLSSYINQMLIQDDNHFDKKININKKMLLLVKEKNGGIIYKVVMIVPYDYKGKNLVGKVYGANSELGDILLDIKKGASVEKNGVTYTAEAIM